MPKVISGKAVRLSARTWGRKPGKSPEAFKKIFVIVCFRQCGPIISLLSIDTLQLFICQLIPWAECEFRILSVIFLFPDALGTIVPGDRRFSHSIMYGLEKHGKLCLSSKVLFIPYFVVMILFQRFNFC